MCIFKSNLQTEPLTESDSITTSTIKNHVFLTNDSSNLLLLTNDRPQVYLQSWKLCTKQGRVKRSLKSTNKVI